MNKAQKTKRAQLMKKAQEYKDAFRLRNEIMQYLRDTYNGVLTPPDDSEYSKALKLHREGVDRLNDYKSKGEQIPFDVRLGLITSRIMVEEMKLDYVCQLCHAKYGDSAEDTIQEFRSEIFDVLGTDHDEA